MRRSIGVPLPDLHMADAYNNDTFVICMQAGYNHLMKQPSAESGSAKKSGARQVLVGVRVSPNFHRRIHMECVRRDQSLQQLVTNALKVYFDAPLSDWMDANITYHYDNPDDPEAKAKEFNACIGLWEKYLRQLPREKIDVMVSAMEWDLQMQKSSRRKSAGKGRGKEDS